VEILALIEVPPVREASALSFFVLRVKHFWKNPFHEKIKCIVKKGLYKCNLLKGTTKEQYLRNLGLRRYAPEPYDGKIYLLLSDEYADARGPAFFTMWSRLAEKGIESFNIPGKHLSFLQDPSAGKIASVLKNILKMPYSESPQ
jgi:thioesterase domain-containing protein